MLHTEDAVIIVMVTMAAVVVGALYGPDLLNRLIELAAAIRSRRDWPRAVARSRGGQR